MNPAVAIVLFLERRETGAGGDWVARRSNLCALCQKKYRAEKPLSKKIKKPIEKNLTKLIGRLKGAPWETLLLWLSLFSSSSAMDEDRPPSGSGGGGVPPEKGGYEDGLNSNINDGASSSSSSAAAAAAAATGLETPAQAADNDEPPQALFDLNSGAAVVFAAVMILLHLFKGATFVRKHISGKKEREKVSSSSKGRSLSLRSGLSLSPPFYLSLSSFFQKCPKSTIDAFEPRCTC